MSTVSVADTPTAPSAPRWLVIALITVGGVESIGAISDLPGIFYQYNHPTALLNVAQTLVKAKLGFALLCAGAALTFASTGRLRQAIGMLGVLALVRWALDVPTSWMIHGVELSGGVPGLVLFAQQFIYPLLGLAALALAWRNRSLGVAAALVAVPPLAGIGMVAAFAIAVAIYGF